MSKGLKLSEILVTVLIAVVFAVIYNLWNFVYKAVQITGVSPAPAANSASKAIPAFGMMR